MFDLKKTAMVSVLAISLGGCQLFGSSHSLASSSPRAMTPGAEREVLGLAALAKGRQQLSAGNFAAAAEAFRVAQRVPDTMADASNGLGVVYSRLQRFDLAERYFRIAVSLQPDNPRFAANLGRMQRDTMLADMRKQDLLREGEEELAQANLTVDPAVFAPLPEGATQVDARTADAGARNVGIHLSVRTRQDELRPPERATVVLATGARTTPRNGQAVKIELPVAKPLAANEFIDATGKLRRVSAAESCIRVRDDLGTGAAPAIARRPEFLLEAPVRFASSGAGK